MQLRARLLTIGVAALTATAHSFNVCLKEPCCEDSKEYTSVEIARQQLYDLTPMGSANLRG